MSWFQWWARAVKTRIQGEEIDESKKRVALIIGVTGIVGNAIADTLPSSDTPGGPWKVYGVARRPEPEWFADSPVEYIRCDVLNKEETSSKLSPLEDVTHLFWMTWANRQSEEENCQVNALMFRNVLDVLMQHARNLEHIVLQTGSKHYIGPFSYMGQFKSHDPPFFEEMPRLPVPNFYYNLEDILFETVKQKQGLTWSVHRPDVIFGFSPTSMMNIVGTMAVYASICREKGLAFVFPGNKLAWEYLMDASDSQLIAEQEIWASVDPKGKNEAFNIANGDVFKWKKLWSLLARKYDLEVPPYSGEPVSLQELMKDKGPVWDEIVKKHNLVPTRLDEVATWWFADAWLNPTTEYVLSMNKSKDRGFFGYRDSEKSCLSCIDKMKEKKIIP
ncbi:hypothetical protein O6H91_05G097600 [Diphasiastrum complanatum]|uniref:Uncharacterized protein n=1 Tax=Diphasiastrum complanatum TaxID=34168 RepID=A0ACC2DRM9_DIPCM|nr:hypothetical protein O6H91_05G097600 [Diphasiastrum complanatum]